MKPEKHWLNKTSMAASLGISTQAFSAWKVDPVAKIGRESFFTVADVIANRERYYSGLKPTDDELSEDERKTAYQLARTRLTEAQAAHQEMKNEMARQEVAPFTFITFVLARVANEIVGVMDGLPMELMRKFNLSPAQVLKVQELTSRTSGSLADLGDIEWLEQALADYLKQAEKQ